MFHRRDDASPGAAVRGRSFRSIPRLVLWRRPSATVADLDQVTFRLASLPEDFPDETFDLIMLSEVLYYLSKADLARVASQCGKALITDGEIVLCHWLGETNYPLTGDEAAEGFLSAMVPRFRIMRQWREPQYRLDLLVRAD